jgi:hypothetical protein
MAPGEALTGPPHIISSHAVEIPLTGVLARSALHGSFLVNTLFIRQKILHGSGAGKTGISTDNILPCFSACSVITHQRYSDLSRSYGSFLQETRAQGTLSSFTKSRRTVRQQDHVPGSFCGDTLLSRPDKYVQAGRPCSSSRHTGTLPVREQCSIIQRGYPSPVKGAGFRVPSRRRSQVQLLLHASVFNDSLSGNVSYYSLGILGV